MILGLIFIALSFGNASSASLFQKKIDVAPVQVSDTCKEGWVKGLQERDILFKSVPKNQGMTNDGVYLYVSPDHHTIEKRDLNNFSLIQSAAYRDKIGGLFYDVQTGEILTCSGEYITGGKAFISRINKSDLSIIATIDISDFTNHGVNAIVKLKDRIYVGETAVNHDKKEKSWYVFDTDFNFIDIVFSHISEKGSYDWQDATVYKNQIIATDHNGFVYAFCVLPNGRLSLTGRLGSAGRYPEGITRKNDLFFLWKPGAGIVTTMLK